jgi:hypothetical protein
MKMLDRINTPGGEVVRRMAADNLGSLVRPKNESQRLQEALFSIQCKVLDWGTDQKLSARQLRRRLMQLREEIIAIRGEAPLSQETK